MQFALFAVLASFFMYMNLYPVEPLGIGVVNDDITYEEPAEEESIVDSYTVTPGTETYEGFVVDNVLHAGDVGDVHYSLRVPEAYDEAGPAALFITLPAETGLFYHGAGQNLRVEQYAFTARDYDENMIIAAPQASTWDQNSADQTIALTEYLIRNYDIDPDRVYIEGYSYGGETLSLVMGTRPDLYRAALHLASQWNGDLEVLAQARVPVRITLGDNDEFYTVEDAQNMVDDLRELYRQQGLDEEEIDELVMLDVRPDSYFTSRGAWEQHGGGSHIMANDDEIMGWLFAQ